MKHRYDTIVSLGWNCEVSFRIEDYLGHKIDSYLYSWAGVQSKDGFVESLSHIDDILTHEITLLPWGMFRCEQYQIDFHGTFPAAQLFDENHNPVEENVAIAEKDLVSRIHYLGSKFQKLLSSEKKTLFLLKPHIEKKIDIETIQYIQGVCSFLHENYLSKEYTLLVVLEKCVAEGWTDQISEENCKVVFVDYFAGKDEVKDSGDIDGWIKLLLEEDDLESGIRKIMDYLHICLRWRWNRKGWKLYNRLETKLVGIYHRLQGRKG